MTRHLPVIRFWAGPRDGEHLALKTVFPATVSAMETAWRACGYERAARVLHDNMTICCEVWYWRADR